MKPRLGASVRTFSIGGVVAATLVAACGSTRTVGEGDPDIDAVRRFDRHPLYWVGERFERWDLESVDVGGGEFVTFSYGTCELPPPGREGGCAVPLKIQIQPLCAHLWGRRPRARLEATAGTRSPGRDDR